MADTAHPAGRGTSRKPVSGAGEARTVLVGSAALTTAVLPYFLVGTLAVSLQRSLDVSETAIGALGTVLFASGAVFATPAGRVVDRFGAGIALRTSAGTVAVGAMFLGLVADRWWQFAVVMTMAGAAMALADTGSAKAFAERVRSRRHGAAFGVKEASIPVASMLAGAAVPTLGARHGWEAAYVAAGVVAVGMVAVLPRPAALDGDRDDSGPAEPTGSASPNASVRDRATVVRFSAGAALGAGAGIGAAVFMVAAFVDGGLTEDHSALVLSGASVGAIVVRVVAGVWADRAGSRPVMAMAGLLVVGGVAAAALALPLAVAAHVAAAVVLMAGAWGWSGLAFLAVVRGNPATPGAAAGIVLTGLSVGGALGPLSFGVLADRVSFAAAWSVVAAVLVLGGLFTYSARTLDGPSPPGRGTLAESGGA